MNKPTKLEIGNLPQKKVTLGVPLTKNGDILLGSTGKKPDENSKIVVSRRESSLYVCRKDGEPIQIGRVFYKDRKESTARGVFPTPSIRKVLKKPLGALVLHYDGEHSWLFDEEFYNPELGPADLQKFFRKIATVSLDKKVSKSSNAPPLPNR